MPRLTKLYDNTRGRLARVLSAVRREPTGARPTTNVRIKLGALPAPLRAIMRDESHGGMLIEAELPWLTVGSEIQAEFPDGREKSGRVHWFGVDATRAGSARLRIFVDLSSPNAPGPTQLPDIEQLVRPRPKRWAWPLATLLLVVVACSVIYVLARRAPQPAPAPAAAPVAKTQPDAPPPAPATPAPAPSLTPTPTVAAKSATPAAVPSHPKPKPKRKPKRR